MSELENDMVSDFLDEASQLVDRLNEDLLRLDEAARTGGGRAALDLDLLNQMFRSAHSIKGLSAMLSMSNINRLTHRIENVLDEARKGELPITSHVVETVFRGIDRLTFMLDRLRKCGSDACDAGEVLDAMERILTPCGGAKEQVSQADAERTFAQLSAAVEQLSEVDHSRFEDMFATIVDEKDPPAKYLSIFIDETELTLDQLSGALIDPSVSEGPHVLEPLLVGAHRIKGSAASLGLNRAAKLAHLMEDVLQQRRDASLAMSPQLVDALLHCTDALRLFVTTLKEGRPDSSSFLAAAQELFIAAGEVIPTTPRQPNAPQVAAISFCADDSERGLLEGQVNFEASPISGLKAALVLEKLLSAGELIECQPSPIEIDRSDVVDVLTFVLESSETIDVLKSRLAISGVESVTIQAKSTPRPATPVVQPNAVVQAEAKTSSPAPPEQREAAPAAEFSRPNETLRVDIERLDQLMNLTGQLVINKSRFARIGQGMKQSVPSRHALQLLDGIGATADRLTRRLDSEANLEVCDFNGIRSLVQRLATDLGAIRSEMRQLDRLRAQVADLFEAVHQLDRVSSGIQKSVMDTRMVPVGPLFQRFKRVVRDITKVNGKDVQLVIRGEKTELDKRMIDELGDPLIHMVRNSADHGIESPDARQAAGKPRFGTITLEAFHRGNSIVILVRDDGKGLDRDRILAKAIERGIVSPGDAEKLSPAQIYNLIWEPGFSTAEKVTEISGRGMGMDIVRAKIEGLNGSVNIDSQPGEGCTFTISLPLTMAILPSLMLLIDGDVFAVPVQSVVEIVKMNRDDLSTVRGRQTAVVRDRIISVVELNEVFAWSRPAVSTRADEHDSALVILQHDHREIGLIAHKLLGEEDVVIKSMAEHYRNVEGVAGASILGDGRVSLIIDVAALVGLASRGVGRETPDLPGFASQNAGYPKPSKPETGVTA